MASARASYGARRCTAMSSGKSGGHARSEIERTGAGSAVAISSRNVDFGYQRVGTVGRLLGVKIRNSGTTPLTLNRISFQSGNRTDFIVGTGCFPSGLHKPVTLAPGASCTVAANGPT